MPHSGGPSNGPIPPAETPSRRGIFRRVAEMVSSGPLVSDAIPDIRDDRRARTEVQRTLRMNPGDDENGDSIDDGRVAACSEVDTGPRATAAVEALDAAFDGYVADADLLEDAAQLLDETPVDRLEDLVGRDLSIGMGKSGRVDSIVFGYAILECESALDTLPLADLKGFNPMLFERFSEEYLCDLREVGYRVQDDQILFAQFCGLRDMETALIKPHAVHRLHRATDGDLYDRTRMVFTKLGDEGVVEIPLNSLSFKDRLVSPVLTGEMSFEPVECQKSVALVMAEFEHEGFPVRGRVLENRASTGGEVIVLSHYLLSDGRLRRSTYFLNSNQVILRPPEGAESYLGRFVVYAGITGEVCDVSSDGQRLLLIHRSLQVDLNNPDRKMLEERAGWAPVNRVKPVNLEDNEGITKLLEYSLQDRPVYFMHDKYLRIPGKVLKILPEDSDALVPYFMRRVLIEFDSDGKIIQYETLVSNIDALSSHLGDLLKRPALEQNAPLSFVFNGLLMNGIFLRTIGPNLQLMCTDEGYNEGRLFEISPVSRRVLKCEYRAPDHFDCELDTDFDQPESPQGVTAEPSGVEAVLEPKPDVIDLSDKVIVKDDPLEAAPVDISIPQIENMKSLCTGEFVESDSPVPILDLDQNTASAPPLDFAELAPVFYDAGLSEIPEAEQRDFSNVLENSVRVGARFCIRVLGKDLDLLILGNCEYNGHPVIQAFSDDEANSYFGYQFLIDPDTGRIDHLIKPTLN